MGASKIQYKLILLALIVGSLIFLSLSLMTSFKKRSLPVTLTEGVGKADLKIGQFTFVQTHEGARDWELQADRAEVFEKDQKAFLEKIAVTMATPQGLELKLEGDEGTIDTSKKDFFLKKKEGEMLIQLDNGYTITTPALKWFNDRREIVTEGPAHISGPQIEIHGKELTMTVENQVVTVSGDVQASIH